MIRSTLTLAALLGVAHAHSLTPPTPPPMPRHTLEFSFGTSHRFAGSAAQLLDDDERAIPITSATVLAEWLAGTHWGVVAWFNLPLGPSQIIRSDGTTDWKATTSMLAGGLRWSPVVWPVLGGRAVFEPQVAAFAGSTIADPDGATFVPVLAARLHLHNAEGLALYGGAAWTFSVESLVFTYGLGYRF